jgi:hypothetical protein
VVKIEYEDVYANKYSKFQGLRVFTDRLDDQSPAVVFTFLEEMDPANPDFLIFGPPASAATAIPGFAEIHSRVPSEIGSP